MSNACREYDGGKLLNVSITVLSLTGVVAQDTLCPKKSSATKYSSTKSMTGTKAYDDDTEVSSITMCDTIAPGNVSKSPTTTVVASFSRNVTGKQTSIMTHVPSLPVPLPLSTSRETFNGIIYWPEQDEESAQHFQEISSFQFQRFFSRENQEGDQNVGRNANRFVPQSCPINLAISRKGKMFKIGLADVLVSGDENGESTINVPVISHGYSNPKSSSYRLNGRKKSKERGTSMVRLKGDSLKCSMSHNATLRVLVRVSDPSEEINGKSQADATETLDEDVLIAEEVMPPRDASWEYDPQQAAIVFTKRDFSKEAKRFKTRGPSLSIIREPSYLTGELSPKEEPDAQSKSTATMTVDDEDSDSDDAQSQITEEDQQFTSFRPSADILPLIYGIKRQLQNNIPIESFISNIPGQRKASSKAKIPEEGNHENDGEARVMDKKYATNQKVWQSFDTHESNDDAGSDTSSTASISVFIHAKHDKEPHPRQNLGKPPSWRQRLVCGLPVCGTFNQGHVFSCSDEDGNISGYLRQKGLAPLQERDTSFHSEDFSLINSLVDSDTEC